jgi:hypothetical protein
MNRQIAVAAAALVAALILTGACASPARSVPKTVLAILDPDKHSTVDLVEVKAGGSAAFARKRARWETEARTTVNCMVD